MKKTILSIHAHPDDTEIFCSGTLFLLRKLGHKVVIVTMTAGGLGSYKLDKDKTITERTAEAKRAANYLGASFETLSQEDGYVLDSKALRLNVTEILRKYSADLVFTHRYDDYHPDHRATAEIVESAAIVSALPNVKTSSKPLSIAPLIYLTDTLNSTNRIGDERLTPHFAIDISSEIENKKKMLSFHQSQIDLMKNMMKMDDFFSEFYKKDSLNGKRYNVEFAEVFWQKMGGGFQSEGFLQKELKEYFKTI